MAMKSFVAIVIGLGLAAGCKTDKTEPAAGSSAAPAESSNKGRSGKIDLPPPSRRPSLPDGEETGERDQFQDRNRGDGRDGTRAERWEERRKERLEQLDTDKNGAISPAEQDAGRVRRAEEMRTRLDADGDGKLTVAELSSSRMSRRLDPAALDADKNGDISAEELKASMDQMRARMRGPGRDGFDPAGGTGSATP